MKFRIRLSDDKTELVRSYLEEHGVEISEDGEFTITEASEKASFLTVRNENRERMRVAAEEVIYIEAFGKEIEIHTVSGTFLSTERMYILETLLDPQEFLRISKSVIVAKKHVKKIRASLSMKYVLTLSDGTLADVTRSYYSDFRRFFSI
ncbi:MAG: LytTR family transcriptional regulator [Lachnospiraceae bacterium]|nr:LytTR family transcriptional regulator [Lachnospiraceae bacterium]